MTSYPKRLIEVDLPIARISAHARREKSIRHGHISTLHIWWARRPLAACRAVLCASLWPDPVDLADWGKRMDESAVDSVAILPQRFLSEARDQMARRARLHAAKAGSASLPRLFAVQKDASRLDDYVELRVLLLDFIADFANWDNSNDIDYLATARALTQAAHEALGGEAGTRPLVVDPFAGGGAIPLEALRGGADAFASDLNPVAVLLNKILIEYVPKYGQQLADELRRWGEWVRDQAEQNLAECYPRDPSGASPIAYLWARTIVSEAPGDAVPVEVPLIKSMWLCKKPSRKRALRWVRDENGTVQTEVTDAKSADGTIRLVRRPRLEVFEPKADAEVPFGSVNRGAATCPVTGFVTPSQGTKRQLSKRRGGTRDARLLCVVTINPSVVGRSYRLPSEQDNIAVHAAADRLLERSEDPLFQALLPTEETPQGGGSGAGRAFSQRAYGMAQFADLYTSRQLLSVATYVELCNQAPQHPDWPREPGLAEAIKTCLGISVSRLSDKMSSFCQWRPQADQEKVEHVFARQALPFTWDFAEGVPITAGTAGWDDAFEKPAALVESVAAAGLPAGTAVAANATQSPLPSDCADLLFTDPPYYDAVPYADLSDYFYVWLKRVVPPTGSTSFTDSLAPKADECIVDETKGKDHAFYQSTLREALSEGRRVAKANAIAAVVFAHKSTAGWESMLGSIVEAGWTITGSWPLDTELANRLRALDSAALASSIHLVCRPRENPDGSLRDEVGEWREVLAELPRRIHEWMPRLAAEGVVGADAIFACLGPSLEVFSRYSRVEKASGEAVSLRDYLEQVWAAVSQEALSMIFDDPETAGLEPDARLTAMWLWTLGTSAAEASTATILNGETTNGKGEKEDQAPRPQVRPSAYALEFDAARKIAQGLGIHLEKASSVVQVKGDKARLLTVAERTRYLFGKDEDSGLTTKKTKKVAQLDLFAELQEIDAAVSSPAPELASPEAGRTVLDRVHQAMILFAAGRGEALRGFLIEDGIGKQAAFWKLAQALSALYPTGSEEKRWVDGVLARKKGLGL